ncbi:autotransporter domain-containing protein [Marinomonas foliarum]|uniref:Autotransporter domain-containing protein n=1 Tax=Marinomonas foliarum TaxID=491950 RepID=A0ABX7IJU2_9GAMM|nr:autotransporter domain-containing protein [Marinomonas foliarum]QRV22602.1 autotransporter domain-containing protein [Marinomonas foliarum]
MNRSFRLVWNAALGLWAVASEAAKGKHKTQSSSKIPKLKSGVLGSVLIAGIGLMPLSNALAAVDWKGGEGSWAEGSNWDSSSVPTDSDIALVNSGTATVDGGTKAVSRNLYIGSQGNSEGTVTVTGGEASLKLTGFLNVGISGKGILDISNGARVTVTSSQNTSIGLNEDSEGTVNITGTDTALEVNSSMYIGSRGKGTLSISEGAKVTSGDVLYIGKTNGSLGTVTVSGSGSLIKSTRNIFVGDGGTATLTISNGAKVTSDSGLSIASLDSSEGTLNIGAAEGEAAAAAGILTVGEDSVVRFGREAISDEMMGMDMPAQFGTGLLVFNHTDTNYVFASDIAGGRSDKSNINIVNGTTRFTGDLTGYEGNTNVKGGTLSIADGETLTLGGNYNQTSGTLKIGASSLNSFGKLKVTGTATFAAGSKINVDVTETNSLAAGSMTKVVEAGTLTSDGFVVTDNSALFDFTAVVEGDNVNLTVVQGTTDNSDTDNSDTDNSDTDNSGNGGSDNDDSATSNDKATVVKYVQQQNFTTGLGAATVLDKFVQGGTTGTGMDTVVTALGKISTGKEVSNAVAQTLPLLSGSSSKVSAGVMQANGNVVAARQSSTASVSSGGRSVETGTSSGDGFISDKNAWVKPVGSWAKQDSRGGVSGYDAETYGIIGGMDGDINDNTSVGFALSYMNTKADGRVTSTTNHADIDAYQAMFYGQRSLGESFHNVDVTWQAGLGVNQTDGTRNINFMSTTAKSDYTSYTGNLSAGLGRTFVVNGDTKLTPSVRADYSYIKDESYKETGADALNLNVRSNTSEAFLVSLHGDLNQRINDSLSLAVSAGVGYDVMNDASSTTASYAGGGASFITEGLDLSPWVVSAGIGVNYALDDATEITVRYDLEGRSDFLSQTATAKFTWMF